MCVMHGRKEECIEGLKWENIKEEDNLRLRPRCEDDIKMDLKEIGLVDVE